MKPGKRTNAMRRAVRAAATFAAGCALVGACTSLDNLAGGEDGGAAGNGSADGGSGLDGSADANGALPDSGLDAPLTTANLIPNPGFELGSGGCGATWIPAGGGTKLDTTPHGGAHSCRVCSVTPSSNLPSKPAVLPIEAGTGFHAEAWFMAPAGAPSSTSVHIAVAMTDIDGGQVGDHSAFPYPTPTSTWQVAQLDWVAPVDGKDIQVALIGYSPDDGGAISEGCVLWDDVSLVLSQ